MSFELDVMSIIGIFKPESKIETYKEIMNSKFILIIWWPPRKIGLTRYNY